MSEPKRRGRPPKVRDFIDSDEGHQVNTSYSADPREAANQAARDDIHDSARTQPDDAAYIDSADEEARMTASHEAAPPLHQTDTHRRRSAPTKIGELELGGLKAEAWEAHDMQDERIRFDTLGRRWLFRPDQTNGHAEVLFQITKGVDVRELRLTNARYGADGAREASDEIVEQLNGAL